MRETLHAHLRLYKYSSTTNPGRVSDNSLAVFVCSLVLRPVIGHSALICAPPMGTDTWQEPVPEAKHRHVNALGPLHSQSAEQVLTGPQRAQCKCCTALQAATEA